ncbi:MAG: UDP-N-acetylmuramoyl-tripeptide--D-alanyl-D-alanine ligase [Ignavibacteria bacterium]
MLKVDDLISVSQDELVNFEKLKRKKFNGVSIDSRKIKKDEIFFAIKGERTDGHKYIEDIFKKGIQLAVVERSWFKKNKSKFRKKIFLVVRDTTKALGEFAKIHKDNFAIPVLCIGGSNGKTTTKDLAAAVLSKKYNVLKTEGNFNNHIGLPLTLLRLDDTHEFCLLEAGTNHYNEIKYLCSIARPGFGLVTNIGREHLEFFKNIKGVAKAEFELYDYLKKRKDGILFFNLDDSYIKNYSGGINDEKKFSYSYKHNADVKGRFKGYSKNFEPGIEIRSGQKKFEARISTFGEHSVHNGLAAAAVGLYFNVSERMIRDALKNFKNASTNRMEVIKINGMTIINDTYNSNPESVKMGLETMMKFKTPGKKIAVLSDMLELGKSSKAEHSSIGKLAAKLNIKNLFTFGKESLNIFRNAKRIRNNFYFESKDDLIEMLRKNVSQKDIIYVKGSRGMRMEEVVKGISEN